MRLKAFFLLLLLVWTTLADSIGANSLLKLYSLFFLGGGGGRGWWSWIGSFLVLVVALNFFFFYNSCPYVELKLKNCLQTG